MAFLQASVALSGCLQGRATLADTLGSSLSEPCHDGAVVAKNTIKFENGCLAHCTADLQAVGEGVALLRSPSDAPVLALPPIERHLPLHTAFDEPQPGTPPPRILFGPLLI